MKFCICGYGGVGAALVRLLVAKGHEVSCITRQRESSATVKFITCDLSQPAAVDELVRHFKQDFPQVVINTIGMLHDKNYQPEKNVQQMTETWLINNISVNVLSSVHLAKALDQILQQRLPLKFVAFSARVGSITDNRLGGWYSYRMSKAMLNMFLKNLSIEWGRRYPQALVAGYHPGTVATQLSEPFQKNVPNDKLFTPEQAAGYCFGVIQSLEKGDSGCLIDWQGEKIEF